MRPFDSGPIYRETLMGRLPVEPWNTWSNIVFLLVVAYWAWRVYPDVRRHAFLAGALPVLFVGFVGGTVFHGTRSHEAWLLMDWVPIVVLCMGCMVLFARRARVAWPLLLFLVALPFVLRYLLLQVLRLPATVVMNSGYALLGLTVLLPIMAHLRRKGWHHWPWMAASAACFGLAVTFRSLDRSELLRWLPMGTHWLWHTFGGVAVHFLIGYIWRDDEARAGVRSAVAANGRALRDAART
ncbi:MAG: ceramidase domain-containing protein [Bacteroidetes bacterium]|nr:ceramidase domain-containing protein [Bacteroidota bacterium]